MHPHNEIVPGSPDKPNSILEALSVMWRDFIPYDQIETFRQTGYYVVQVAPGIRVLALNTLYFFDSNSRVPGCDVDGPGRQHIKWIRDQLTQARRDGARVYMIGHVPPSEKTFYPSCLSNYTDLAIEFADIVAGHMYGHVNIDHFMILRKKEDANMVYPLKNTERYMSNLRRQYKKLAKDDGQSVVVHVSPPLLPIYFPGFRINRYETNPALPSFGTWQQYTQWYVNLTYWNQFGWFANPHDPPPKPVFEIEYMTDLTYGMSDLSTSSWIRLAQQMTEDTWRGKALWETYTKNMLVHTGNE